MREENTRKSLCRCREQTEGSQKDGGAGERGGGIEKYRSVAIEYRLRNSQWYYHNYVWASWVMEIVGNHLVKWRTV